MIGYLTRIAHLRTPIVLVAGDDVTEVAALLPNWGIDALREAGALNGNRVAHVGFVWGPDRLIVVLPKAYDSVEARAQLSSDPEWVLSQVFLLIRLLARCRRDGRFSSLDPIREPWIENAPPSGTDPAGALEAAIALRADFLERGLYWERGSLLRSNDPSNPIDWARTIRSGPPLLDGNNIIWFDTVHRARARNPRDPLHRLHAWSVAEVLALTGEPSLAPDRASLAPGELAAVSANPQRYVDALLTRTYRDRGRYLLRLIGAWLGVAPAAAMPGTRPAAVLLLARSFENVWEHVLRQLIDEDPNSNHNLPSGKWMPAAPGDDPIPEGAPKYDILRREKERIYLLDAKDKRVKAPKRSGTLGDHYKQTIYAQLLDLPDEDALLNVLLFPTVLPKSVAKVLGVHQWPQVRRSRVVEVAVDFERVVRAWLGDESFSAHEFLSELREQVISSEATERAGP